MTSINGKVVVTIYNKPGDEGTCYTLRSGDGEREVQIDETQDAYSELAGIIDDAFDRADVVGVVRQQSDVSIAFDNVLRTAYSLLGDGLGTEWGDPDRNEYTRGIAELISDLVPFPFEGDLDARKVEALRLVRASAPVTPTRTVWVVDEDGATFWFDEKADAEKHLVDEAWRGAVHLSIGTLKVPANLEGNALDDYVVSHAPSAICEAAN